MSVCGLLCHWYNRSIYGAKQTSDADAVFNHSTALKAKNIAETGGTFLRTTSLTLFSATTNGHFLALSRLMLSIVCGSRPCIISTTRIAISQREEPRVRRLLSTKNISQTISYMLCNCTLCVSTYFANISVKSNDSIQKKELQLEPSSD